MSISSMGPVCFNRQMFIPRIVLLAQLFFYALSPTDLKKKKKSVHFIIKKSSLAKLGHILISLIILVIEKVRFHGDSTGKQGYYVV